MTRSTKKLTLEEFLTVVNAKHKGYYTYPRFVYVNNRTKSIITCPVHRDFLQTPKDHMKGRGCRKCGSISAGIKSKPSLEEVIASFELKHKGLYDYSEFLNEGNNKTKNTIICRTHGRFLMTTNSHQQGQGCPKCIGKYKTLDEVISELSEKHDNLYDYSEFNTTDAHEKGIIICKVHGRFTQTLGNHRNGQGCPHCRNENRKYTLDEVLKAFELKHNGKYGYTKVVYEGGQRKVIITCSTHGDFKQTPNSHSQGAGCPSCKESRGEKAVATALSSLGLNFERQKSFDGCFDVIKLRFDFYLPNHNLLIEFDGLQHFQPIAFWGGVDAFNESKRRDAIKSEYCTKNNIKLLRIPYTEKNIEELIRQTINN